MQAGLQKHIPTPERIGRFLVDSVLGRTTLTETLLARASEPLPGVAADAFVIKVLRGDCPASVVGSFVDTARSLQWSCPPGVAKVVEVGESPGPVFAAFELRQGVDLRRLRRQAVPTGACMDVRIVGLLGRKLAEKLAQLHGQADGLRVHGGLAPGNVLALSTGDLLLLDCGIGEALRSNDAWPSESWRFAAPEQLRGERAEAAADYYAVGALMYFLFYGRPPFEGETPAEVEARIAEGPPALDGLHPAVASAIARMLSHARAARPKSAAELTRQISVALLSASANVVSAQAPVAAAPTEPVEPQEELPRDSGELAPADRDDIDQVEAQDDDEIRPFVSAGRPSLAHGSARPAIAADDPDVGVIYDDEDDEDDVVVGADGTVKRRRRKGRVRLLEWTKSAFARKVFRYAWVPVLVFVVAGAIEGYFFLRSWRKARELGRQRDAEISAELAKREAAKPKLAPAPTIPAGHLVLKISPPGATVWIDGREEGNAPATLLTQPGPRRLVITATGYRMLRDVVDTTHGALFEREMVPAVFPQNGSVGLNVACATEGKYPVFIDGKEIGALCPIAGVRLDPGKHMVGIFVIPQNRIWSLEREIVAERPHRVQFNY